MLIKRNDFMPLRTQLVKKMTSPLLVALTLLSTSIAPAAFAGSTQLVDKTVTVKIQMSEIKGQEGTEKTYAKLKKRAKSYCRSDSPTLQFTGETVQACADDLLNQFIESANIDQLTSYHSTQGKPTKLALNKF